MFRRGFGFCGRPSSHPPGRQDACPTIRTRGIHRVWRATFLPPPPGRLPPVGAGSLALLGQLAREFIGSPSDFAVGGSGPWPGNLCSGLDWSAHSGAPVTGSPAPARGAKRSAPPAITRPIGQPAPAVSCLVRSVGGAIAPLAAGHRSCTVRSGSISSGHDIPPCQGPRSLSPVLASVRPPPTDQL